MRPLLSILSNLSIDHMVELAEQWGGVPRTIRYYYSRPNYIVDDDYSHMARQAVTECKTALLKGPLCDLPDDALSSFYFIRPQKNDHLMMPYVSVPTRTLRYFLSKGLQYETKATKLEFFFALSMQAETCQSVHYIYKSWFHSFFPMRGKDIRCHWQGTETLLKLTSTTAVISATQDTPASSTPPFYWIPRAKNFPGIDSALILTDEIIVFQVTFAAKDCSCESLETGMLKLHDLLSENLKDAQWRLVFVGTENDHGELERMAAKWVNTIVMPTRQTCVQVGWAVVDPVCEDVVYTVRKNVSVYAMSFDLDVSTILTKTIRRCKNQRKVIVLRCMDPSYSK